MTFYNFRRPHQAMNNQMPIAGWLAGMDKIEAAARAVDMPLRLDNANALPTYPQQEAARSSLILEGQRQARSHLKFNPSWSHEWDPVQWRRFRTNVPAHKGRTRRIEKSRRR